MRQLRDEIQIETGPLGPMWSEGGSGVGGGVGGEGPWGGGRGRRGQRVGALWWQGARVAAGRPTRCLTPHPPAPPPTNLPDHSPTPPPAGDNVLRRFLRARKHNIARAKDMFLASLKWRREQRVDSVLEDFVFHERKRFAKNYPEGGWVGQPCCLVFLPAAQQRLHGGREWLSAPTPPTAHPHAPHTLPHAQAFTAWIAWGAQSTCRCPAR